MPEVTIKQLLEAGVHFGHQTQRWNPKMKKYIYGERNGIYIINLEITLVCIQKALAYLKETASQGGEILLVGTKKQAQEPLRLAAESCEMPFVEQRWLGGMLTNFETVRKSVGRLDHIDKMEQDGSFKFITKKEVNMLKKEREKLMKNLRGVRNMRRLPKAIFVIDSKKEEIALKEAAKLGITVVAILDTNCDPDLVDYPLPGNDDAIRAVRLFCQLAAAAIKEGRDRYKKVLAEEETRRLEEEAIAAKEAAEKKEADEKEAAAKKKKEEKDEAKEKAQAGLEVQAPSEKAATGEKTVVGVEKIEEGKLTTRLAQRPGTTTEKSQKMKPKTKKPVRKDSGKTKSK